MKDFQSAIKNIKNKNFSPIYLIYGEESYYIKEIIKALEENVLDPATKDFNYTKIYGNSSVKVVELEPIIRSYPMMSDFRLIVVKDANKIPESELAKLESLFKNPPKQSITVWIFNKHPDRRKKWVKAMLSNATTIEAKPIRDREIKKWINFFAKKYKLKLSPLAVETLVDNLPSNINVIENEIKKLKLFCYDKQFETVSEDVIYQFINISKEESVFALLDYLGEKNLAKSIKVLNSLLANPNYTPTRVLYHLYNFFMHLTAIKNNNCKSVEDVKKMFPNLHTFVAQKYFKAAQVYDASHLIKNMEMLTDYDALVKGVVYTTEKPEDHLAKLLYDLIV